MFCLPRAGALAGVGVNGGVVGGAEALPLFLRYFALRMPGTQIASLTWHPLDTGGLLELCWARHPRIACWQ
jgi:hypothetical protein